MLKTLSQNQLKIGLGLAFALFLVNGQNNSTAARARRAIANSYSSSPSVALAASTTTPISPAVGGGVPVQGCASAQRQVQLPADAVLNLRSYANGPVIATLTPGTTVTAQRSDGTWLEVTTGSGQSGWAFNQYLGCL